MDWFWNRSRSLALLFFAAAGALGAAGTVGAEEQPPLQPVLSRRIIDAELPLGEVQAFTESRVPAMPDVRSAEEWTVHAERIRREVLDGIVFRGEAALWRDAAARVVWTEAIDGGPGYRIRKLRYEAVPDLWIPALLYEPLGLSGRVPAVLNVNGHEGQGKAVGYKQIRCINQAKRGMLALNVEWLGMGQLQCEDNVHYRMNQIDVCGSSGLAPFYLAMRRGLDVLLSHPNTDPERVAVAGLSGGGWQTIFLSSLDTRVKLANPVAGYSSFRTRTRHVSDLGDSEQTPCDLATVADYLHLTAMLAPRPALLTNNSKDECCFAAGHALPPLLEAARPIYALFGAEACLHSHVNDDPGTHNFERENREALYRAIGEHFFPLDAAYSAVEIPSDAEVKSREALSVDLPAPNATLHSIAMDLCRRLPRDPALPVTRDAVEAWREERSEALRRVVRAPRYEVRSEPAGGEQRVGEVRASFWRLRAGDDWTLPATELWRGDGKSPAVLLVADAGRAAAAAEIGRQVEAAGRILALDPFYLGESRIPSHDFLFALLVAAVGERPLGIQASQIGAVARWLSTDRGSGPIRLVALGPRSSLMALVAAALETEAIASVEIRGSLGSLRQVVEENRAVDGAPELFCFGLLEAIDIRQLAALIAPRPVRFVEPSDRVRAEMAGLRELYGLLGSPFDPLR